MTTAKTKLSRSARFRDKVAVVTGAAGGIGAAVAQRLAEEGARLVLVDIDTDRLDRVRGEVIAAGHEPPTILSADVSSEKDVQLYVRAAVEAHGGIDVFFNNAGIIGPVTPIVEATGESFDQIFAVNVKGVFLGLRAVLKIMAAKGTGAIVNTASTAAFRSRSGMGLYGASKQAIIALTRTAAIEMGPSGIRVNAVCPGVIDTDMPRRVARAKLGDAGTDESSLLDALVRGQPLPRPGTPQEVANLVGWLLSEEASYATGGTYQIDGGYLA